jgi:hypothetical protein
MLITEIERNLSTVHNFIKVDEVFPVMSRAKFARVGSILA